MRNLPGLAAIMRLVLHFYFNRHYESRRSLEKGAGRVTRLPERIHVA
jgi:hypothetical protein